MRFARAYILAFSSLLLAVPGRSQQTSTTAPQSSPQAVTLLQQSLAAFTGGHPLTDVTLTGTARRIAGSDDETGTATYQAVPGTNRLDLSLSGGARSEIANLTADPPVGSWSGPDGVSHTIAFHNLQSRSSIFPAFVLANLSASPNLVLTLVGQENKAEHSVYHLSASQQFPQMSAKRAVLAQHLTQMDVFLDASTLLPVALDFNTHPDDDAGRDIPIELLFSDYRTISGVQIPFRVQKFLNNGLTLDLQFQNAAINSGLLASQFTVQGQ
jgi:hypothetical protein